MVLIAVGAGHEANYRFKHALILDAAYGMELDAETDYAAIFAGEASVTPLHLDPTHTESLNHLSHWAALLASK